VEMGCRSPVRVGVFVSRPCHLLCLLPVLAHLFSFCTMHHAHSTPLQTTPPVNTTPMSCSHSPPVLSQIQAYNHTIKSTSFNYPLPSFHPTILRSLHTETTFYLPQLPPPTSPIIIPIADPASPTHIPHTNSYVVLLQKESCTCISIPAHHAPSTSHMRTPGSHVTTHITSTSLTTPTRPPNFTKTNTPHSESHPDSRLSHPDSRPQTGLPTYVAQPLLGRKSK